MFGPNARCCVYVHDITHPNAFLLLTFCFLQNDIDDYIKIVEPRMTSGTLSFGHSGSHYVALKPKVSKFKWLVMKNSPLQGY